MIQSLTLARLRPDTPLARRRICLRRIVSVWHLDAEDIHVQEVVDYVHAACCGGPGWTVDVAVWEGGIRYVVGCFEVVGEFVEDVVYLGCVGAVVCSYDVISVLYSMLIGSDAVLTQEHDQSFPARDQITHGRPIINCQCIRTRNGHKRIRVNPTLCKRIPELGDIDRVPIRQEQSHNFVCIGIQPVLNSNQERLEGARILKEARGVTQFQDMLVDNGMVRLRLQEADAHVELGLDVDVLVLLG